MESCVGVAAPASPGEEDWQQQPAGVMDCQTREAVHSFPKGSSQLLEASSSSLSFDTRMKRLEDLVATLSADNQVLRKENESLVLRLSSLEENFQKKKLPSDIALQKGTNILPNILPVMPSTAEDALQLSGNIHQLRNPDGFEASENAATCTSTDTVETPGRRKKKRNASANDMSHYSTRHVALKLMYLGSRFHGFASSAGLHRTVESELFAALAKTRLLIGTPGDATYSRCGRTDKGVSAIGQVIALHLRSKRKPLKLDQGSSLEQSEEICDSESPVAVGVFKRGNRGSEIEVITPQNVITEMVGDRVARARASRTEEELFAATASGEEEIDYVGVLNRALPEDIRVLGWCPVPKGFSARFSCLYREYKYYFIDDNLNIDAMKVACKAFEGDHDFTNFCKMDAANVHNYVRTITNFDILPFNEMWGERKVSVMRVKGTAFLWHQVRCMAAVLFMVGSGHESPTIVGEMLDVHKYVRKPQYILAPERPLLLFHCGFQGLSFHCHPEALRRLRMHLETLLEVSLMNASLLLQGLLELTSSENRAADLIPSYDLQSVKSMHVPLRLRPTEPTYAERQRRREVSLCDATHLKAIAHCTQKLRKVGGSHVTKEAGEYELAPKYPGC